MSEDDTNTANYKNVRRRPRVSRPKQGYKRWLISNIWLFLVIAVIIFWILVWTLSDWAAPRIIYMVTVAGAAGIAGLMVLTYRFAKYIKELARATDLLLQEVIVRSGLARYEAKQAATAALAAFRKATEGEW